jgi:hypothetical protein
MTMFYPGEVIINESTIANHLGDDAAGRVCGTKPRDFSRVPVGSIAGVPAAGEFPMVPREEWPDRISQMEREKSRLSDMIEAEAIPALNQQHLSFCWAYSLAGAAMALRAQMGLPMVMLSPESVAAPINGFRDGGNYIGEALSWGIGNGIASEQYVPHLAVSQREFQQGWEQDAAKHKILEHVDLGQKDGTMFDRLMTILFARLPIPGAHNWWRHSTFAADPVMRKVGNKWIFGTRERNSWGPGYGANGWFIVDEPYCFDEAYAPSSFSQG